MEKPLTPPVSREEDVKLNKDTAAFSYIWIMSMLVYLGRKDSPFIQHHSRQGLILFVISIPLWFIPLVGHLLEVIVFAGMVMGFINAFQGQWTDVPLVGPLSRGEMSVAQAFKTMWSFVMRLFRQASHGTQNAPESAHKTETSPPSPSPPPTPPPSSPSST